MQVCCFKRGVQKGSICSPLLFPAILIRQLPAHPWNTNMVVVHWWWWKGDIGHLVIMTSSFSIHCLCIISSIRADIIDSLFMLIVDLEQIPSHVVFWPWHLKWNEEGVRFKSDSRMFLLSGLSDSLAEHRHAHLVLTRQHIERERDLKMYFTSAY